MQMPTFRHCAALSISNRAHECGVSIRVLKCVSHTISIYTAQGAIMFHRTPHRVLNIQLVVKPNDQRNPLFKATLRVSVCDLQLGGEFDKEVRAISPIMTPGIREIQMADKAVQSLV